MEGRRKKSRSCCRFHFERQPKSKNRPPKREAFARKIKDSCLCLNNLARFEAGRADAHALGCAVHDSAYRTQIHIPAPPADVVSVADVVSKLRPLAAQFTYSCHGV